MARSRVLEHVREGLPWALGVVASCTYFNDAVNNEGKGAARLREAFGSVFEGGKQNLVGAAEPLAQLADRMLARDDHRHSDAERFLNKPMPEQMRLLRGWLEEGDWERGLYYLALFARDRGNPYTDSPVNADTDDAGLMDAIFAAHAKGVLGDGLLAGSVSALAVHPSNAQRLLTKERLGVLARCLQAGAGNEADTAYALKALALAALHQPKSGEFETLVVEGGAATRALVPLLLTILMDPEARNVFEPRYSSQLLSCLLRCYPSLLKDELSGTWRDSEGKPLTVFRAVREGLRFRDQPSAPYYLRLISDCIAIDDAYSWGRFADVDLMPVLVGRLVNAQNHVEVQPLLARFMLQLAHHTGRPGELLEFKEFVPALKTIAEGSGVFTHETVIALRELLGECLMDPTVPEELVVARRAAVQRVLSAFNDVLVQGQREHISAKWIASDTKRRDEARVTPLAACA